MEKLYDLLILGGGPAGLTAAIYAGRYNMKTLVVANRFGGTANLAGEVENWPGYIGPGIDLMRTIKAQAKRFGAEFLETDVKTVTKNGGAPESVPPAQMASTDADKVGKFVLNYDGKEVRGKSLLIALGTENRQLNIPGEKEFLGKGVSYCATCDGNFFKNKTVAVIGGADSAAKAALYLADICKKVYIIYRKNEMRCEPISLSKIRDNDKIEIFYHSNPTEIFGDKVVMGLKILQEKPDEDAIEKILNVDGVFIEVGATPAIDVVKNLGLKMKDGYIVTDKKTKTNIDGVFAAGDVTNTAMRQMISAAGEGAIAAKMAHEFLMGK